VQKLHLGISFAAVLSVERCIRERPIARRFPLSKKSHSKSFKVIRRPQIKLNELIVESPTTASEAAVEYCSRRALTFR
jgi:hypothetical protein